MFDCLVSLDDFLSSMGTFSMCSHNHIRIRMWMKRWKKWRHKHALDMRWWGELHVKRDKNCQLRASNIYVMNFYVNRVRIRVDDLWMASFKSDADDQRREKFISCSISIHPFNARLCCFPPLAWLSRRLDRAEHASQRLFDSFIRVLLAAAACRELTRLMMFIAINWSSMKLISN